MIQGLQEIVFVIGCITIIIGVTAVLVYLFGEIPRRIEAQGHRIRRLEEMDALRKQRK